MDDPADCQQKRPHVQPKQDDDDEDGARGESHIFVELVVNVQVTNIALDRVPIDGEIRGRVLPTALPGVVSPLIRVISAAAGVNIARRQAQPSVPAQSEERIQSFSVIRHKGHCRAAITVGILSLYRRAIEHVVLHISERRLQRRVCSILAARRSPLHRVQRHRVRQGSPAPFIQRAVLPPVLPTALIRLTTVPIRRRRPRRRPRARAFRLTLGPKIAAVSAADGNLHKILRRLARVRERIRRE